MRRWNADFSVSSSKMAYAVPPENYNRQGLKKSVVSEIDPLSNDSALLHPTQRQTGR
ncbi:hypothetical protein ACSS6W_002133 [Trichoderma asperelloides]